MTFYVQVERLSAASYDEVTLLASSGSRTVLWEGWVRIWEIQGDTTINIGEADLDIQSTQISFPFNTPLWKRNDEVLVLETKHDDALVGKRYQIQSSAKAGELRPSRRYAVTAVN